MAKKKPEPETTEVEAVVVEGEEPNETVLQPVSTSNLDEFGYRPSSLKARAAALYAREQGATLQEVKAELNSTQLNLLRDLEGRGFEVRRSKEDGKGGRKVTRYFLVRK